MASRATQRLTVPVPADMQRLLDTHQIGPRGWCEHCVSLRLVPPVAGRCEVGRMVDGWLTPRQPAGSGRA